MTAEQTSDAIEADGGGVVEPSVGESSRQRGTARTAEHGTARPLLRTAGNVLAAFAVVGAGYGLAANFTVGFLIETFVEPGTDPLNNTLVGIVLVTIVVNTMMLGPVMAGVTGLSVGRSFPGRGVLAATLNGTVSVFGFYLLAAVALFLTFSVVSQYAPAEAADAAASGAGSSGGGGPFTFEDLRPTLVEVGIPTGVVGAVTGYAGSWLAE